MIAAIFRVDRDKLSRLRTTHNLGAQDFQRCRCSSRPLRASNPNRAARFQVQATDRSAIKVRRSFSASVDVLRGETRRVVVRWLDRDVPCEVHASSRECKAHDRWAKEDVGEVLPHGERCRAGARVAKEPGRARPPHRRHGSEGCGIRLARGYASLPAARYGLWEVRSSISQGRIARVIFCIERGEMVILRGFLKKTRKTAPRDID